MVTLSKITPVFMCDSDYVSFYDIKAGELTLHEITLCTKKSTPILTRGGYRPIEEHNYW